MTNICATAAALSYTSAGLQVNGTLTEVIIQNDTSTGVGIAEVFSSDTTSLSSSTGFSEGNSGDFSQHAIITKVGKSGI